MTRELGCLQWGNGPRRILLLHGLSSNAAGWWRLGPDLASDGWQVTAPDLRGHGTSPLGDGYRIDDYAGDVLALGSGWDAALGHSLGGAVAVVAHQREPRWARGMILQDPALVVADAAYEEVLAGLLEPIEGPVDERGLAAAHPEWHETDRRIKVEALRQSGPTVVRQTMAENRPWNLLGAAVSATVPTVVLGSDPEHGGILPVAVGEWLAAENAGVAYRMIPEAGHSVHRDDRRYPEYLAAVREALETIEEGR